MDFFKTDFPFVLEKGIYPVVQLVLSCLRIDNFILMQHLLHDLELHSLVVSYNRKKFNYVHF